MKTILQGQVNNDVLLKTGGTMVGDLILNRDPVEDLQAATRQYVDNNLAKITAANFSWGDEAEDADQIWWAQLSFWLNSYSTAETRAACLGKTKSVTLSTSVLGTTTHLVQCIGYDCDGTGTLTFQTKDVLTNTTAFCTSAQYSTFGSQALWYDGTNNSTARTQCINYYNAFPGKAYIKTVSKKYCSTQGSSHGDQTSDQVYDETVFLPSEIEMGLNTYSAAKDEFCTENTEGISYQLYTSNASRIKYDTAGTARAYWERSRYSGTSSPSGVCIVGGSGSASWNYYHGGSRLAPAFVI